MISRRAQKITRRSKQHEYYSDFKQDFDLNPVTGWLEYATNIDAVKESVQNLVLTRRGERFYHPELGSDVSASLFDNFDDLVRGQIQESIRETVSQNEPRVKDLEVQVIEDLTQNAYVANIRFSVINIPNVVQNMSIIIGRVR